MIVKSLTLLALMVPGADAFPAQDSASTPAQDSAAVHVRDSAIVPAQDSIATYELDPTVVSARVADKRTSPLRLTDIDSETIRLQATGRTFPELVSSVPGVYSTSETGSYGDARMNIRGFKQENISILLNGIPISGLTSGSMYWNNWMGLSDATASIQVQKGIGNSMLSDNSVGGTVNIITSQPAQSAFGEMGYSRTGYGTNSLYVSLCSGQLSHGWSISAMGSHNWGSSYVDCSNLSTWSYYLTLNKSFKGGHKLNFTALGSPETHQQRSSRLSCDEVEKYGISYNKSWGWMTDSNGLRVRRTLAQNTYFKPYFTLTHSWKGRTSEGDEIGVATTLYGAYANGGGYYTESTGRRISSFVIPEGSEGEGQIDWDAAYAYNRSTSPDQYGRRAQNIMTDYLAGHTQAGVKSSFLFKRDNTWDIDAGLNYQYYSTWEKEQITDLLGADYWYEDYENQSLAGTAGRDPIKKVGDYVRTDNGRDQHYATIYSIGTYKPQHNDRTILTLGVSLSGTVLRRRDLYNYTPGNEYSDWASRAGGSIKAGVLQKVARGTAVYLNAAAYSRAPYAGVFFPNGNNSVSNDISNEKNYLGEAGIRSAGDRYSVEMTGYVAYWKDKSLLSSAYKSLDEEPNRYMVTGLDALHYGGELNASYSPWRWFTADAFASVGDWRWRNDVNATIYDPVTMKPSAYVKVYADGLHVGDAPQTQVGAGVNFEPLRGLKAGLDWSWNSRMYADFDPVARTDPDDRSDSYMTPDYHLLNLRISWSYSIKAVYFTLFFNANNLTDAVYIERGKDGTGHDAATFTGYWGNRRNFNFGVKIGSR